MKLREQKKVAAVVVFSVSFFIFGIAQAPHEFTDSSMIAKQEVKIPQRGIASE